MTSTTEDAQSHGQLTDRVETYLSQPRTMLIGGQWVPAASGRTLEVIDPATGRQTTTIPAGDGTDADRAVTAARRAFEDPAWRGMSAMDRGELLHRFADLIEKNGDELAALESRDNGKPMAMARAVDVGTSVKLFRYFSGWSTKYEGSTIPVSPRGGASILNYTVHEPVGVVAAIIPWNFPMSMACWKLAPALAMGNTVILKPSEETSLTTLRMAELFAEAGFPDGVVNVVTGTGLDVGAALARHDDVDKIAFTGSTAVGREIACMATGNMKRVSLELGGKSPQLVLPDADLDAAAAAITSGIFFNQGQVCNAGSRAYIHDAIYEPLMERMVTLADDLTVGPGSDPGTDMGPLVSKRHLDRVMGFLDQGRQQGAQVVAGGARPDGLAQENQNGYFLRPTIFDQTEQSMSIVQEEIFGPVLSCLRWSDVDELVKAANDSPYGLAAGVWTRDVGAAHRVAGAIQAGTVWVNCYNMTDPASPFGGYKQSGWGREMGREVLSSYTETKSVWVNIS